jgi:hypothetical protein
MKKFQRGAGREAWDRGRAGDFPRAPALSHEIYGRCHTVTLTRVNRGCRHHAQSVRIVPLSQQKLHQQAQPETDCDEGAGVLKELYRRELIEIARQSSVVPRCNSLQISRDVDVRHVALRTALERMPPALLENTSKAP